MTPDEQVELLIRVDERVGAMHKTCTELPCAESQKILATHTEKLKTHDKFIWGLTGTVLTAICGFIALVGFEVIKIVRTT